MKNSIVLLIILCSSHAMFAQGSWTRLLDQPAYGLSINPKNPRTMIVGGLGRTLYRTHDAGITWEIDSIEFRSGSSQLTNVLISSKDTNVVLIGGVFNSIRRSTNQGREWETVFETEKPQFLTPGETIIESPIDANVIYAGDNASNRIFRSNDAGITWDTLGTLNVPSLCTIAIRPDSSNIMYAGCKTGIIERSTDAGATWNRVTVLRSFQDAEIPKIVFSAKNPMLGFAIIAYFLPGNIPNGGVFRTTDGGYSWKEHSFRDTSFWSICFATKGQDEDLFLGGFSDATDVIPGPGLIMKTQLSTGSTLRFDDEIPWYTNPGGAKIRRNVWMLRSVSDASGMTLYAATEAGLYRYSESLSNIQETSALYMEYSITDARLTDNSHESTVLHVLSLDGRVLKSGNSILDLSDLPEGAYCIRKAHPRFTSLMLMKVGDQLFPHFGK